MGHWSGEVVYIGRDIPKIFFYKQVKKSSTQVITAQLAKCRNMGVVELNIRIRDFEKPWLFHVLADLEYPCILGIDFTGGSKIILDFDRKSFAIQESQKLVMVSDGTEFAVGDIEKLFEEARRNTETKHEKWKKYYNRSRRDVQIKDRIYRHRKCDETEIGTGSSDNGSLRDESSGFDRVQRRSNDSRDGKKKGSEVKRELEEKGLSFRNNQGEKHTNKTNKRGPLIKSIPSSWSEKGRMIKKSKNQKFRYKRANESRPGGPERKVQKGSEHRVPKRALSSNYRTYQSDKI
ncbi:uncharacterized protein TNCV_611691 [Trichonephila clavipes]|nr:uncharacterized protein TNCV_611691 [Trichonephila clavipes]